MADLESSLILSSIVLVLLLIVVFVAIGVRMLEKHRYWLVQPWVWALVLVLTSLVLGLFRAPYLLCQIMLGLVLVSFIFCLALCTEKEREDGKFELGGSTVRLLLKHYWARIATVVVLVVVYWLTMDPYVRAGTVRFIRSPVGSQSFLGDSKAVCGPRFHLLMPFLDSTYDFSRGLQRLEFSQTGQLPPIRTETRNGHEIDVDVAVVYKLFTDDELDEDCAVPEDRMDFPARFGNDFVARFMDPLVQRVVHDNVNRYHLNQVYSSTTRALIQSMITRELRDGVPRRLTAQLAPEVVSGIKEDLQYTQPEGIGKRCRELGLELAVAALDDKAVKKADPAHPTFAEILPSVGDVKRALEVVCGEPYQEGLLLALSDMLKKGATIPQGMNPSDIDKLALDASRIKSVCQREMISKSTTVPSFMQLSDSTGGKSSWTQPLTYEVRRDCQLLKVRFEEASDGLAAEQSKTRVSGKVRAPSRQSYRGVDKEDSDELEYLCQDWEVAVREETTKDHRDLGLEFKDFVILDVRILDKSFAEQIRKKHLLEEARASLLIEYQKLQQQLLNSRMQKTIALNESLIEADRIKVLAEAKLEESKLNAEGIRAVGDAEAEAREALVKAHETDGEKGKPNNYARIEMAKAMGEGIDRIIVTPSFKGVTGVMTDVRSAMDLLDLPANEVVKGDGKSVSAVRKELTDDLKAQVGKD